ncbi:hypothetical protein Dimus_039289 [Dionaea muscipula]
MQKGYRCYSPELGRFCISTGVFHEATPFNSSSPSFGSSSESSSSVDDLLVYELVHISLSSTPVPVSTPVPAFAPVPTSPSVSASLPDLLSVLPLRVYTRCSRQVIIDQLDHLDECAPPVVAPTTATPGLDPSSVVPDFDPSPSTMGFITGRSSVLSTLSFGFSDCPTEGSA